MSSLAQLCGGTLQELDLTSCVYLTDLSVNAIATYLHRLVVLRLAWCKEITDWGLLGQKTPTREREGETVRKNGERERDGWQWKGEKVGGRRDG